MNEKQPTQGVSNPPDGGNVEDVSTPDSNDSTVAQSSAPNQNTPPPTPQGPTAGAPPQASQTPGQPQTQGPASTGPRPNLAKAPGQSQPQGQAASVPQQDPAVQQASRLHDVAETLAGGPRYTYDVDAYGNQTRKAVPVSGAHIALALALQALSGATTGLANGAGPSGRAKAAATAAAQSAQRVQQNDVQQRAQAQENFNRRAQVTETNMRMYANARSIGRMDAEDTDQYVNQYKDLVNKLQTELPGYIKGIAKYSDFPKYNITQDNAIPYARVPRLGPDGKQVTDARGVPQWDVDYMIIDPAFKASGLLSDHDLTNFKEMNQPWADNSLVGSAPLTAVMALNKKAQSAMWDTAKSTFNDYFNTLDKATEGGGTTAETPANLTEPGSLESPTIKNANVAGLVNQIASKYAPQVKNIISPDNFQALIRGMVVQESGGDPNKVSPAGAQGVMQIMPTNYQALGITNPKDPQQNINGGVKLFTQLLQKYKDPTLALAAYNSSPAAVANAGNKVPNIAETQNYVKSIGDMVGLTQSNTVEDTNKTQRPSLAEYTAQHATTPADVEKLIGALNGTDGNYGKALEHLRSNPQTAAAANNLTAYLGGPDAIKAHDDYVTTQTEQRKADITEAEGEKKAKAKHQLDQENADKMAAMVQGPDNFEFQDNMSDMGMKELQNSLQAQGVQVPNNFADLYSIAKYQHDPNNYAPRTWLTGNPYEMDKQSALSYIQKFINPDFDQKRYGLLTTTGRQLYNPDSRINRNIQAIGTATNHMELLRQAAHEVASGQPLNGQFPALNRLAGEYQIQTGQAPYLTLQALTRRVNNEISNVAGGGFAPHAEDAEATMKNMTAANAEAQIDSLIGTYTGIMQGRLEPVNAQIKALTGEDLKTVSPETTQLFQRYNLPTPWAPKVNNTQNNVNQNTNPNVAQPGEREVRGPQGQLLGFTVDGKTLSRLATSQ
jgi:hypothetical protein